MRVGSANVAPLITADRPISTTSDSVTGLTSHLVAIGGDLLHAQLVRAVSRSEPIANSTYDRVGQRAEAVDGLVADHRQRLVIARHADAPVELEAQRLLCEPPRRDERLHGQVDPQLRLLLDGLAAEARSPTPARIRA